MEQKLSLQANSGGFMPVTGTLEVLVLDQRRFTYRQTYSFNTAALCKFVALNGPLTIEADPNGDYDLVLTLNPELL